MLLSPDLNAFVSVQTGDSGLYRLFNRDTPVESDREESLSHYLHHPQRAIISLEGLTAVTHWGEVQD